MADQKGNINRPLLFGMEKVPSSLWDSLIQQLEKDVRHSFAETDSETVYTELYALIKLAVENGSLPQLLYRIDVSEDKARQCSSVEDPVHCLVQIILEREAQKVLFRNQYKGKI